jgi:hypothetical protein
MINYSLQQFIHKLKSTVGKATRLRAGQPRKCSLIPGIISTFVCFLDGLSGPGSHQAAVSVGNGVSFPREKRPVRAANFTSA